MTGGNDSKRAQCKRNGNCKEYAGLEPAMVPFNTSVLPEFFEMVDELEKRLEYAREHTNLPKKPNDKAINDLLAAVNEKIVAGR